MPEQPKPEQPNAPVEHSGNSVAGRLYSAHREPPAPAEGCGASGGDERTLVRGVGAQFIVRPSPEISSSYR